MGLGATELIVILLIVVPGPLHMHVQVAPGVQCSFPATYAVIGNLILLLD